LFDIRIFSRMPEEKRYENMAIMLKGMLQEEKDTLTQLCNASALINALLGRVNWCGFYLMKQEELVLGPFQGMPACTRIQVGKGVCGTAAKTRETMLIKNVHEFEGHIACDAATNSEIVLPIVKNGVVYGVLDIDSEELGRFTEIEKRSLEGCVELLNQYVDWEKLCR